VLLAVEGADFGTAGGDARRLLVARLVINHRLRASNPLAYRKSDGEDPITDRLLEETPVPLAEAADLVEAAAPGSGAKLGI
jgi:hypothetical protein